MITSSRHSTAYVTLAIMALASTLGCKTPTFSETKHPTLAKVNRHMPWYDADEPRLGMPERMVGNWTDTVLYKEGQKPQRGFGGRVLFFAAGSDKPILVEGQMVIYAFDEANRNPTDNTPTRRYVFPADQLPPRMSESDLGVSYNFFLPWDDMGGPQTDVSLMCRFEPKGGAVVVGEQTRHRLPGPASTDVAGSPQPPKLPNGVPYRPATEQGFKLPGKATDSGVRPASFDAAIPNASGNAVSQPQDQGRMNSTSIALPESMQHGGQGAPVHNNRAASQQPAAIPVQALPANGQLAPSAAAANGVTPTAMGPTYQQYGQSMVPTNQSGVAMNTPAAAVAVRAGGYRLLPQQTGTVAPFANTPLTGSPTFPPAATVQPGAGVMPSGGIVPGTASAYLPPAGMPGVMPQAAAPAQRIVTLPNGQQVVFPEAQQTPAMGQTSSQTIAPIGQQQYSMQGYNDHQPYTPPANQMLPTANNTAGASYPTYR